MKLTNLTVIEISLNELGTECRKLSELEERAQTSQATIKRLEDELADLHSNRNNHEQRSRATRLTTGNALLSLERSDLATLNSKIENQIDCVVEFHRRAADLLQQVWSAVLAVRKASVETMLAETFDLRKLHMPVEMIANAAHSVSEIEEMQGVLFAHRGRNERDAAVSDARLLRERSAPLIAAATDEPDLVLDLVLPSVTPIASQPKHVVTGNQLGTLISSAA